MITMLIYHPKLVQNSHDKLGIFLSIVLETVLTVIQLHQNVQITEISLISNSQSHNIILHTIKFNIKKHAYRSANRPRGRPRLI